MESKGGKTIYRFPNVFQTQKVSVTKQCRHRRTHPSSRTVTKCMHYDWQLSCSRTDSCTVNVYFNYASYRPWPSHVVTVTNVRPVQCCNVQ